MPAPPAQRQCNECTYHEAISINGESQTVCVRYPPNFEYSRHIKVGYRYPFAQPGAIACGEFVVRPPVPST